MGRLIAFAVWVVTFVVAARWLDWDAMFHVVCGTILAGTVAFVVLLFRWQRRSADADEQIPPEEPIPASGLRTAVLALICAVAAATCLQGWFVFLNDCTPIPRLFYDYDRSELETRLAILERAGDHQAAIEQIRARLEHPLTDKWRNALIAKLYDDLIEAGRSHDDLPERADCFRQAQRLAAENGLDAKLADSLLGPTAREIRFVETVTRLQLAKQWDQLAGLLRAAMAERPQSEWRHPLARWLCEALVECGKISTDAQEKIQHFGEAVQIAHKHSLSREPAQSLLGVVEKEMRAWDVIEQRVVDLRERRAYTDLVAYLRSVTSKSPWRRPLDQWLYKAHLDWAESLPETDLRIKMEKYEGDLRVADQYGLDGTVAKLRLDDFSRKCQPVDLPLGVEVGFERISTDNYPPVLIAHVWVERGGVPFPGLKEKDFFVNIDGKSVREFQLSPFQDNPPPLYILLALDISASMKGAAFEAVKRGAVTFLAGLARQNVHVLILTFESRVCQPCPWTTDLKQAASHLDRLTARGNTALYQAVSEAVDHLSTKDGERQLVVFTDGKDTLGGPAPDKLVNLCLQHSVVVHAIGLRTGDLDSVTLSSLASQTGGDYLEANRPEDIVDLYHLTARRVSRNLYRLVVTPPEALRFLTDDPSVEVRVGGANAVSAEHELPPLAPSAGT